MLFLLRCVSAKFHLWPSSGDLPRPQIGMLSLVTVSPVITAFHSCCLSHHVFDQVNLWPAWVGFETAISPGILTWNRRDSTPLSAAPCAPKGDLEWIFWSYKSLSGLLESGPYRISTFLSEVAVNHLKKARGEIWPKRSERRNNTKTTKMRTKSLQ